MADGGIKKAVGLVHPRLKIKPDNGSKRSDQGKETHPPERQKRVLSVIPDTSALSQRKRVIRSKYNRFQGFVKATTAVPGPNASSTAKGRRGAKRTAHVEQCPSRPPTSTPPVLEKGGESQDCAAPTAAFTETPPSTLIEHTWSPDQEKDHPPDQPPNHPVGRCGGMPSLL